MEDLGEVQPFTEQWGTCAHGVSRVTHELVTHPGGWDQDLLPPVRRLPQPFPGAQVEV